MKLKRIAALLAAASLCIGLAACGKKAAEETTADKEDAAKNTSITLTESWEFDSGFYPVVSTANSSNYGITYWTHNFYDTLVKYNTDGEIVGALAESWEINNNGKTYTFKYATALSFPTEATSHPQL